MPDLNIHQKAAVQTLSGPMLVLAGAGTGKTRVVTYRIARLIASGIAPDRILAVTFTNKAALEMKERVSKTIPGGGHGKKKSKGPKPTIGTFHSHCVQILKRHATKLGYPQAFAIYDRGDCEALARSVLRELRLDDVMIRPGDFLSFISKWKSAGVTFREATQAANTDREHLAASGYARYQRGLKLCGAFDFDDLLLCVRQLFEEFPDVLAAEAGRYDHILVDEYQDTNRLQYDIIRGLAAKHRNLCVVGDDDQSIYGWRGAEVKHILNFRNDWPDAVVIRLEDNYRSTDAIINVANNLIAFNAQRHGKVLRAARPNGPPPRVVPLKSDVEEAKFISQEILSTINRGIGREPRDFAILFRTNEQPRIVESELRAVRLPYQLSGTQSFFDRKEIRDLLSYLRFATNPNDEISLLRIINTPSRGIGASSIEKLMNHAVRRGSSVWQTIETSLDELDLPAAALAGIENLRSIRREILANDQPQQLSGLVETLVGRTRYMDEIARNYRNPEEAEMRRSSVGELATAVAQYLDGSDKPTLEDFLASVTLEGREFSSGDKERQRNAISLMTYHSAKGLEFPIVYMIGMEEGILPHRRSIAEDDVDEERRLCYVGITRAQEELTLTFPLSRKKWGKDRSTIPSRFLYELTGQADNPNRLKAIKAAARLCDDL